MIKIEQSGNNAADAFAQISEQLAQIAYPVSRMTSLDYRQQLEKDSRQVELRAIFRAYGFESEDDIELLIKVASRFGENAVVALLNDER